MIEQQLRERITASTDDVACAPVPLADIRSAGRALARRRTGVRVAGSAAAVVGVGVAAVALPSLGPGGTVPPAPATQSAQPSTTSAPSPGDRRHRGEPEAWTSAEINACLEAIGEKPVGNLREALSLGAEVLRECDRRQARDRR